MTQEKFEPRLHSPNPDHPTWAKCGRFSSGVEMASSDDLVTCGHCMRKLGNDPRKRLAAAVAEVVTAYDKDEPPARLLQRIGQLAAAWHVEQDYISSRRYYR